MKINRIIRGAVGIALAVFGVNANALTSSGNLTPSITISAACTVSVSNFAFPNTSVSAAGTVVDGLIGSILVGGCPNGAYWLGADGGTHYNSPDRNLQLGGDATNRIVYTLDLGGAGVQVNWGTAKGGTALPSPPVLVPTDASQQAFKRTGASGSDVFTVTGHATIPIGVVAGTYTDTVIIVAEF